MIIGVDRLLPSGDRISSTTSFEIFLLSSLLSIVCLCRALLSESVEQMDVTWYVLRPFPLSNLGLYGPVTGMSKVIPVALQRLFASFRRVHPSVLQFALLGKEIFRSTRVEAELCYFHCKQLCGRHHIPLGTDGNLLQNCLHLCDPSPQQ